MTKQLKDITEDERIQSYERKVQRKIAQMMHKTINSMSIKVQLKGAVNDNLQSVIQLPKGLWLLIDMDLIEPEFIISEDRQGYCILYFYDNDKALLLKEIGEIIK
ncbi:hypothetical protein ACFL0O_00425 [Thermodesulfobacteriota bacterium]